MFSPIGRCYIDIDRIRTTMSEMVANEEELMNDRKGIWNHIYSIWGNKQSGDEFKLVDTAYEKSFSTTPFSLFNATPEERKAAKAEAFLNRFNKWLDTVIELDITLKCYYIDEKIALVGTEINTENVKNSDAWLLSADCITLVSYKDYSNLTKSERLNIAGTVSTVSALANVDETTYSEAISLRDAEKANISDIEQDMEDVKNAKTAELAALQKEIDEKMAALEAKKADLLADLNARKAEMEAKLRDMEVTVMRLDAEIYSIRCYTGEVLELKKIREGRPAPAETPLVFYQKMRYLDEELGKIASIYDVDFNDAKHLEGLIKNVDSVFNTFCPSERSLMLIRVSKSNKGFTRLEGTNILDMYEKYHGRKVALVIRDGENCYIAWTDDNRINFADDAFYKAGTHELSDIDSSKLEQGRWESDDDYAKRMHEMQKRAAEDALGRSYIWSLMQGIIDRNIIVFPEHVRFGNSQYVIFNYAEGWLGTNEYGTFEDIINRCNKNVAQGDMLLTTQSLRADQPTGYMSHAWSNDRGRGEKNRTHDVYASDNTIYPVNLVECEANYSYTVHQGNETYAQERTWTQKEYSEFINRDWSKYNWSYSDLVKKEGSDRYYIYISLEKDENWKTGKSARANFELYKDEFINLTFMNSVWLEYVLNNQKANGMYIGGAKVDFAYVIPYIKTALQHVKTRENKIAGWISKIAPEVLNDAKWPVKLSEWMLEKDIHNFSEFRTKQFCKAQANA